MMRKLSQLPLVVKLFQRVLGANSYIKQPFGLSPFLDLKYRFPKTSFKTFFDVGANISQTENEIIENFPSAQVLCFEPIPQTFELLKQNIKGKQSSCFLGLGDKNEVVEVAVSATGATSSANSIIHNKNKEDSVLTLNVVTFDSFVNENGIKKIDYLK